jgi:glycosyltransferase involved in cell wall biosynthesis
MESRKTRIGFISAQIITASIPSAFYKLTTSSNQRDEGLQEILKNVFDVSEVSMRRVYYTSLSPLKLYLILGPLLFLRALEIALKSEIVVAQGYPDLLGVIASYVSKKSGKSKIFVIKDTHWYWPSTRVSRVLWPVYLYFIKKADIVIVPGKASYVFWIRNGIDCSRISIVHYYWLESTMKECKSIPTRLTKIRERSNALILYLGRLIKKRGVDILIRAFDKVRKEQPNATLIIAGSGPDEGYFKELASNLGLKNIMFLGPVKEDEKQCLYRIADLFAYVPVKTTIPEEWPIPPLEAIRSGIIPIVSDIVGSIPDLKPYVIIVPEGDVDALAQAILKVLRNSEDMRSPRFKDELIKFANSINPQVVLREFLYAVKNAIKMRGIRA